MGDDIDCIEIINAIGPKWKNKTAPNTFLRSVRQRWGEYAVERYAKYVDRASIITQSAGIIETYLPELKNGNNSILDMSCGPGIFLEVAKFCGNNVFGTDEPKTVYEPFLKCQKVPHVLIDGGKPPYNIDSKSHDIVSLMNAIHFFPTAVWIDIMHELFRIARNTVFVVACSGPNYDGYNQKLLLDTKFEGWTGRNVGNYGFYIRYDEDK